MAVDEVATPARWNDLTGDDRPLALNGELARARQAKAFLSEPEENKEKTGAEEGREGAGPRSRDVREGGCQNGVPE